MSRSPRRVTASRSKDTNGGWTEEELGGSAKSVANGNLRVFISWSGERSRAMAQALRTWLPLVLHFVDPWLSEVDIEPGRRWGDAVAKELEASSFGIICVTRENISAPWVLFEAGALAKSLDGSKVIPILVDIEFKEISGPLAQFQAKKVEMPGILEVVRCMNDLSTTPISQDRLKQLFEALWPSLEAKYKEIPAAQPHNKNVRPQSDVLEELVKSVRSLDAAVASGNFQYRNRRKAYIALEIAQRVFKTDPRRGVLIVTSLLKDDAPWIHELALEAMRSPRFSLMPQTRAFRTFREAVDFYMANMSSEDKAYTLELFGALRRHLEEIEHMQPQRMELSPQALKATTSTENQEKSTSKEKADIAAEIILT